MKKYFKILRITLVISIVFCIQSVSFPQPPPPPQHGLNDNSPPTGGAGAPIGEGMFLLIGLAGLYGGKKVYDTRKSLKSEDK